MQSEIAPVLERLNWMRQQSLWPNGERYLWTDAFGVVLLLTLYQETGEEHYLDEAHWLVAEVERVLGRERGIRIGEAVDRDGQYFHYLAMWLFALARFGEIDDRYRQRGIELVREIHRPFLVPGVGLHWKMLEDLSGPYPGFGLGAMDAFDGYVSYRLLDEEALASEIADLATIIDDTAEKLTITQDLGLGMMLWLSHFFPTEDWAVIQKRRCLRILDRLWQPEGFFGRYPLMPKVRFAFTNYGVAIGLQAVDKMPERVAQLIDYFDRYSHDEYDTAAITPMMACSTRLPGLLLQARSGVGR